MIQQNPNIAVWKTAKDYVDAASLLEESNFRQGQVLAALAIEILLKAFLAERTGPWQAKTKRGHSYMELFSQICQEDKEELNSHLKLLDPSINLESTLRQNDGLFTESRYLYEETTRKIVPGNTIHFANLLCQAVAEIGTKRSC